MPRKSLAKMTVVPTESAAERLATKLKLNIGTPIQKGLISYSATHYYVYIWDNRKKPSMRRFEGTPVKIEMPNYVQEPVCYHTSKA